MARFGPRSVESAYMIPIHFEAYHSTAVPLDEPRRQLAELVAKEDLEGRVFPLYTGERWIDPDDGAVPRVTREKQDPPLHALSTAWQMLRLRTSERIRTRSSAGSSAKHSRSSRNSSVSSGVIAGLMSKPRAGELPFPESLCHQCAAPPRYVRTTTTVFILCPLLPNKYPPQPVRACPLFRPRPKS